MVKGEEGAGADARGAATGPRQAGAAAAGGTWDGERVGAGQEVQGDGPGVGGRLQGVGRRPGSHRLGHLAGPVMHGQSKGDP